MLADNKQLDLAGGLASALDMLRRWCVPFIATPAATRLEQDLAAMLDTPTEPDRIGRIETLEGSDRVMPREFARMHPTVTSRTRYFLDGVQRTFPLGWCGMSTLALATVVSGVVERRMQDGVFHAVHGMTAVRAQIIVASSPGETASDALVSAFREAGFTVNVCTEDSELARPGDFLALQSCLRPAVMAFRDACESETYGAWQTRFGDSDGWLLVDGQLADGSAHHALGLIKQHNRFDFTTAEMLDLLSLPVGQRTTAFRRTANKYQPPTTWYLRLHDGSGVNPLYGLARIEAPASVAESEAIDVLAGAVFAERTPRAMNDPRWPTLLYPIHLTERILKTKLDRATHQIPGTLRRYLREAA